MRNRTGAAAVAFSVLLVCVSGCGQKRVAECNALIKVINGGVEALEKAPRTEDPTGVADLQAMASTMEKVGQDMATAPLTIVETKRFATDYQKMAKDIVKAERDLAAAATARDIDKRAAADKALEAAMKLEDPIIDGVNKFCQTQ
jgi:hypothetical protein